MRKEDIVRILDGLTISDEQVKALLDMGSADITKALNKQKADLERLQADLNGANQELEQSRETIKQLEASQGDAAKLQAEIERYKQAEAQRQEAEKQARAQAELEARFNAVSGDRRYIHDLVRKGVIEDFGKALGDKANLGKSDAEVFDALTKDKGYFARQNPPPANMGGMGDVTPVTGKEKFKNLSLYEQFIFAKEHPEQAKAFLEE